MRGIVNPFSDKFMRGLHRDCRERLCRSLPKLKTARTAVEMFSAFFVTAEAFELS